LKLQTDGATNEGPMIKFATTTAANVAKGFIAYQSTGGGYGGNGKLHLGVASSVTATDVSISDSKVTIQGDGNVGIGTTSPGAKLTIGNGTDGNTISFGSYTHFGGSYSSGATFIGNFVRPIVGGVGYEKSTGATIGQGVLVIDQGDFYFSTKASDANVVGTAWSHTAYAKMFLSNAGNVGIGTTAPSYLLHVNGTAYAAGAAGALSDERHKDKIATLAISGLDTVAKLRAVSFVWKDPRDEGMKGLQIGFIAQEVEKVLPEVVLTEPNEEKTKGLKYNEIIPVLTKAIQELKAEKDAELASKNAEIKELQQQISEIKRLLAK